MPIFFSYKGNFRTIVDFFLEKISITFELREVLKENSI